MSNPLQSLPGTVQEVKLSDIANLKQGSAPHPEGEGVCDNCGLKGKVGDSSGLCTLGELV